MTDGPDFSTESQLMTRGYKQICGVDEVGRGPLAGPVVAVAVVLNPKVIPDGLNDSKKLTEKKRELLFDELVGNCHWALASVSAATLDRINIREASLLAMKQAINGLELTVDHALIDGNTIPTGLPCEATDLVKGDGRSLSIAAASIIAKVMRDRMMVRAGKYYPHYQFGKHKGYGTKIHMEALDAHGPCPLHRQSFAPIAKFFKA